MSELSPETEELLEKGRAGTPLSASHRDELKGAVLAKLAIGAGAAGTSLTATSTSAAAWTMTTKTIGVAVIAAVIGTGTVGIVKYQRQAHTPQESSQPSLVAHASNAHAANDSPAPSPTIATPMTASVNAEAPQTFPIAQSTPLPTPVANSQTSSTTTSSNSTHASSPSTAPAISGDSQNTANSPAIVRSSNPSFATMSDGNGSTSVNAPAPHPSSLAEENALLRSAHDAIAAGDPARALRLLDEDAARFPSSAMEPERSAERVFAFCAEQNTDAARAAAGTFLSAHPTGPLAMRVRESCGGH